MGHDISTMGKVPFIGLTACFCLFCLAPLHAEVEQGSDGFKRIKVENRPVGSKINIQIDPDEQALLLAPPDNPRPTTPIDERLEELVPNPTPHEQPSGNTDWFWANLPNTTADANRDKLRLALNQIDNAPEGFALPDTGLLTKIVRDYGKTILRTSIETQVSPPFIAAVIAVESAGNPTAVSSADAQGLMQLIPATAKRFNVADPHDPEQNIKGGARYLSWLLREFRGDPILSLAGYNAGENAVKEYQTVPPYEETRAYVPKVIAAWKIARLLCTKPPEFADEPCLFQPALLN